MSPRIFLKNDSPLTLPASFVCQMSQKSKKNIQTKIKNPAQVPVNNFCNDADQCVTLV